MMELKYIVNLIGCLQMMHGTPLLGMKVEFLPPNVSDHSQVSVRTVDTIDFGPKHFKFHSFWLTH